MQYKKFNTIQLVLMLAVVLLGLHYIINLIFKTDEPFFFLLAFGLAAGAITAWIFQRFGKKSNRELN